MITITGILRRLGPLGRKLAWNREFKRGTHFSGQRSQVLISIISKYCKDRRIVELACGDGSLAREMRAIGFLSYKGYDISEAAIEIAKRSALLGQEFFVADMKGWNPSENFDVLIIEEAIYYIDSKSRQELLIRSFSNMSNDGVAIIALHSKMKFKNIIEEIRGFSVEVSETYEGNRCFLVINSSILNS